MKVLAKLFGLFFFFLLLVTNTKINFMLSNILGVVTRSLNVQTDFNVYEDKKLGVLPYDPSHYTYLLNNEDLCRDRDIYLVIFVKTHPENFERRMAIRDSWGKLSNWGNKSGFEEKVVVLFMLGVDKTPPAEVNKKLRLESSHHGDIIQDNFKEDFYNLTVKLVSQYRWMSVHCSTAKYFMTADDDVFVHTDNLVKYLNTEQPVPRNVFVGHVHSGSPPFRDISIKYNVPASIYRGLYYPDYCAGAGYVLSMDVVESLLSYATTQPLLYIDDVYTGILARLAGVSPVHNSQFYGEGKVADDPCFFQHFITSHGYTPDSMRKFFDKVRTNTHAGSLCWLKL